jgi:hypothetical protein
VVRARRLFFGGRGAQAADCPATGNRLPATIRSAMLAILLLATQAVYACPVCWGAPDDPMVKGVNNGIWVLLGLVGFVQIGFVALFWSFWRRGREQRRFRESLRVIEGGPHA